jgi:1-deoxy-D-xylulose-5-phosphate synthase
VPILSTLQGPADLRGLDEAQLAQLAAEIRQTIVRTVAVTGGHLGSSLGVVELTIALHRLLESPRDKIVWDTGHQAYPHKLLTGRLERFGTLRQLEGIGGFPRRSESEHDVFDGGHAGTGLSIAEGLAAARDLRHGLERIAVVVGDAALMSGLSLEALNDIGHRKTQMLIVLNDNEMSISPTVGAFSKYLSQIKLSRSWRQSKSAYDRTVERIPVIGPTVLELSRRLRKSVVNFAQPGSSSRTSGSRTSASSPATTCTRCSRRWAGRSTCPGRRSSTSGRRRAAGIARPRPTRSASTGPRSRR